MLRPAITPLVALALLAIMLIVAGKYFEIVAGLIGFVLGTITWYRIEGGEK